MDERERFRRLVEQPKSLRQVDAERMHRRVEVKDGDIDYGQGAPVQNVTELHIGDVNWPDEPYGYKHAQRVSALSVHICKDYFGITNQNELNAVRVAGMLHDACRREHWTKPDPEHNHRAAEFCERYLQKRNEPTSLIERSCRLLAHHDLSRAQPSDPLAQALWDADSLESARFSPGQPDGLRIWVQRRQRLCTEYARRKDIQNIALRECGWNLG